MAKVSGSGVDGPRYDPRLSERSVLHTLNKVHARACRPGELASDVKKRKKRNSVLGYDLTSKGEESVEDVFSN